jgi:hypothetical protein
VADETATPEVSTHIVAMLAYLPKEGALWSAATGVYKWAEARRRIGRLARHPLAAPLPARPPRADRRPRPGFPVRKKEGVTAGQ